MSESIFNLIPQHDYSNTSSLGDANPSKTRPDFGLTYHQQNHSSKLGAKTISGMTAYELALASKFSESEEYHRAPKITTKPAVPVFKKQSDLDPSEIARRRQQAQMRGGQIANILGTTSGSKGSQRLAAENNKMSVKEQSIINGLLKEQESNPAKVQMGKDNRAGKALVYPGQKNFVEGNKNSVAEHAARKVASMTLKENGPSKNTDSFKNRPKGQIPKYLIERKIEMQVEKAMAEEVERKRNGGLEVMPEAERLATLEELDRQKRAALQELNSIPPSKAALEGYKAQAKKLEERLKEIDKAVTLFSKKVVYIQ
mmetsp:Transcript_3062/g.7423  ORF Transcript_3062/g.7423 Transcript_3062/m.7423 type:complete len:314 (-) Transcript_3062:414-1355(-)